MTFFFQLLLLGLLVGSTYAVVAVGFVLIYKSTRILNFSQGSLVLVGAYFFWQCSVAWQLPTWLGFILTLLFSALVGWVIERVVFRHMIGQPILSLIMVTLGISVLLEAITHGVWGPVNKVPPQVFPQEPLSFAGLTIGQEYVWIFGLSMVLMAVFILFFQRTKIGLGMRATSESHELAQSTGIDVRKVFSQSWIISAMIAAVAGIFMASIQGVSHDISGIAFKALPAILLGGLESIPGAIVGGLFIGVFEYLSAGYLDPYLGGGFREAAPYIAMIPILLVRPYGFFGLKEIERV